MQGESQRKADRKSLVRWKCVVGESLQALLVCGCCMIVLQWRGGSQPHPEAVRLAWRERKCEDDDDDDDDDGVMMKDRCLRSSVYF